MVLTRFGLSHNAWGVLLAFSEAEEKRQVLSHF
jgi:hypothetical protein